MWHRDESPNPAEYGTMPDGYRDKDDADLIRAIKGQLAKGAGPGAVDIYNGMLRDGQIPASWRQSGAHVARLLDTIAGKVAKGEAAMDMEAAVYGGAAPDVPGTPVDGAKIIDLYPRERQR